MAHLIDHTKQIDQSQDDLESTESDNCRGQAPESDGAITLARLTADDVPIFREFITESRAHLATAESKVLVLETNPQEADAIDTIFRCFHTIKGVAGFLNLTQVGALAHMAENLLNTVRQGRISLTSGDVDMVLQAIDQMKLLIDCVCEAVEHSQPLVEVTSLSEFVARLENCAQQLQERDRENAVPAKATPASCEIADVPDSPVARISATASTADKPASPTRVSEGSVTVSTERLDALINMVGELVIAHTMVNQDVSGSGIGLAAPRLSRNLSHLGKIARSLQDLSMAMRMVPIQGVFQKMARLARDVARKSGKEIDLVLVGEDTELDRNVVEAVSDPLIHMVRNAIDHGIEAPDQRQEMGKPRVGRVHLKACHHSGNVVVEISDDGRGLNKSRIVAKAVTCGIVKEGQDLEEEEIFRLIFHPGLSTAETATDISGRGVGMDVARRNVEALRGRIDIASEEGRGSLFTIRLPLTLAVIDGLVARVGSERYIVPITSVEKSLRLRGEQLSTIHGKGEMCLIRGRLLPLVRLSHLFSLKGAVECPAEALVVIVHADRGCCCLMVDELLGQQQVVIKSLGERLGHVPGISGGAILGDGHVSLILDIPELINLSKRTGPSQIFAAAAMSQPARRELQ
jgi:two-component system chemotaxis sensor kinase CheA